MKSVAARIFGLDIRVVPYRHRLLFSIVLTIVGYESWGLVSEGKAVVTFATRAGGIGIVVICGVSLVDFSLRFTGWCWYLYTIRHRIPVGRDLRIYLSGFALTAMLGKAGEAIRSLYLLRSTRFHILPV